MSTQLITFPTRADWLKGRNGKIGGSDAACVLGLNPWKSNIDLFDQMIGEHEPEDISDRPAVQYGIKAEHLLRELFKLDFPDMNVYYIENNMFINQKYPFAHASLDGWLKDVTGRKGVWECKTTEIRKSEQWDEWDGRIPDHYLCQLAHQLMVTEFDFAVLTAQIKYQRDGQMAKSTRNYFYERSELEDYINSLCSSEKTFMRNVENGIRPSMIVRGYGDGKRN